MEKSILVAFIRIQGRTLKGVFRERPNRFLAVVKVEDRVLLPFLPNPGRMRELLVPGAEVVIRKALNQNRKTSFDMIGVIHGKQRVSVDSRVSNKLFLEALRNHDIKELSLCYVKPEFPYGHIRFDFLLTNNHEKCLVEAKSTTLVKDGVDVS